MNLVMLVTDPRVLIELVLLIQGVIEFDQNKLVIAVIINPLSHSFWHNKDITLPDWSKLLVAVFDSLLCSTVSKLQRRLVCVRTTWENSPLNTLTCIHNNKNELS